MRKVKIITDSSFDLPEEWIKKHDIYVVPFYILFGEETYRDGIDITTDLLYEKIKEKGILPKSAAISPEEWKTHFDKFVNQGYDVLCLTISSKSSSTFQYAYLTSQEYEKGRVVVVNTKSLSGGFGLLTLKAADLKEKGYSALKIKDELEKMIPKLHTQFVIQTLEYLYKGGRCSNMARIMGSLLAIKPQIKMNDGQLEVYKKTMGKISRAVDAMLDDFFKLVMDDKVDLEYVFITHSKADKMEGYILDRIKEKNIEIKNLIVSHAGALISTHCGAGTIGILYLEK